jgi:hypothetical protein
MASTSKSRGKLPLAPLVELAVAAIALSSNRSLVPTAAATADELTTRDYVQRLPIIAASTSNY